ncbi:sugar transferase [Bacteriovoracaceae bacterium]|nr:sugar transferase [Bacteriovoracaceae bacterium]
MGCYLLIKRLLDIYFSIFLLIMTFIPFLIYTLFFYWFEKGPIIHWSRRIGFRGKLFTMPKVRTMILDCPQVATHLLNDSNKYYTRFGRILRKSSFDELPQLVMILIGKMSFIGPRPALFNQFDLIKLRNDKGINDVLPGVTGWAQVNGRDNISIKKKVDFDEYYVKNCSFKLDMKIIFLTFWQVIFVKDVSH